MIGIQYQDVETDSDTAYMYALGYDFATGGPDATLGDRFWLNLFNPVFEGNIPDQSIIDSFFNDTPASTTKDLGIYVNDQIDIDQWSISLGLRYDDVKTDTGSIVQNDYAATYSIGVLYAFDLGLSPYISYAESFEPVVGTDTITGDPLKPREGEQIEFGVKYQPSGSRAFVTLARFDIEESNLSNPNSLAGASSQQEGISEVKGTELEAYFPLGHFTFEVNASLIDTENPNGFRFASVPRKQASTWIGYRPDGRWQGFKTGAGARYVGESWDVTDKEYMATCLARGDCFMGEKRVVVGTVTYNF